MTLPAKFVERVLRDLGGTEGAALCAALDAEPPVSVRLNPAKTGAASSHDTSVNETAANRQSANALKIDFLLFLLFSMFIVL